MKTKKRGGLGRGLGALIPSTSSDGVLISSEQEMQSVVLRGGASADRSLEPVPGASFREVPVTAVTPNPRQPRTTFDEEELEELKISIREVGVLQPIVVREIESGQYELVMGERRWRACQAIGRDTIPAIVRDTSDDDMLRDALLENIHRSSLNPLEEAAAYQQLLAEFGVTHDELAARIGRSRPQISNTIRLLNLPPVVQRRVAAGVLTAGHARALLALDSAEQQEDLAHRIVAEGMSVRATEELISFGVTGDVPTSAHTSSEGQRGSDARRAALRSPGLDDLVNRLSDRFDTRVKIDLGRRKGKVVIEFATVDDLERIATVMGINARLEENSNGG